jgi:enoyl-CoA hydratase/carnithine racemase
MVPKTIIVEKEGSVGIIRLNHPEKRNALSALLVDEVVQALQSFDADPQVNVVAILSTHPTVFCAGRDLDEGSVQSASDAATQRAISARPPRLFLAIRSLKKVVVAGVNGFALAGGLGLAVWCDLVVASEKAVFGLPEINVGLFPSVVLPALGFNTASAKKCLEMILTGERITAADAEKLGIVNSVVPADRLEHATLELARKLAAKSPHTLQLAKKTFYNMLDMEPAQATRYGVEVTSLLAVSRDGIEGQRAFLEKREPRWQPLDGTK